MPKFVEGATRVQASGNMPKLIDEYVGRLNTGDERISVAHMRSPAGWQEPGQTPDFDEYTVVLRGVLHVAHKGGVIEVKAGQAIVAHAGEWIQYSTPNADTEYIAICTPAFSPETVHRE